MRSAETEHGQKLEPHEGNSAAIELCAVSEAQAETIDSALFRYNIMNLKSDEDLKLDNQRR